MMCSRWWYVREPARCSETCWKRRLTISWAAAGTSARASIAAIAMVTCQRTIGVGMGAVEISLPRVSDVPPEVSPDGYHSEIVSRYQRRSRTQGRRMARLYLEGLASGDFEPVFRALVGETAALSPSSILKLK